MQVRFFRFLNMSQQNSHVIIYATVLKFLPNFVWNTTFSCVPQRNGQNVLLLQVYSFIAMLPLGDATSKILSVKAMA